MKEELVSNGDKKEEKFDEVEESPVSAKPKRKPKPTYEYEIFLSQQQHSKRQKKLNEKEQKKQEEGPKDLTEPLKKL